MVVYNLERVLARVGPKPSIAAQCGKLRVLEGRANSPMVRRIRDARIAGVRPVPSLCAIIVDDANVELRGEVVDVHELAWMTAVKI